MFAPSTIEYLDAALFNQAPYFLLCCVVLLLPPHHQKIDTVYSKSSIVVFPDSRIYTIKYPFHSFIPVLVNRSRPSEVVMRVRNHMNHIIIESLLCSRKLFFEFVAKGRLRLLSLRIHKLPCTVWSMLTIYILIMSRAKSP